MAPQLPKTGQPEPAQAAPTQPVPSQTIPKQTDSGLDALLQGVTDQNQLLEIFDVLVNVMFCVKNTDNRYVAVNSAFVRRTGRTSKRDVIGRMANELFSTELAERYEEQDAVVFSSGKALRDELELIRRPDGSLGWYLTTKLPIFGATHSQPQDSQQQDSQPRDNPPVTGILSVSRDLETTALDSGEGGEGIAVASLSKVVLLVNQRFAHKLPIADLAEAADCSPSQLKRRMKRVFGLTPTQFVLRVRVDRAAELLRSTDVPLADIATGCGFYDQAEFTRKFARLTNETPARFRASHR